MIIWVDISIILRDVGDLKSVMERLQLDFSGEWDPLSTVSSPIMGSVSRFQLLDPLY